MVKTRFAPSPTGLLHVGSLRAALYEYLFAKKNNGSFLLRIEDTDRERLVEGGTENILNSLHWAGICPDEGVILDEQGKITEKGESGPYVQSGRLEIYKKYVEELVENDHAYYCFCTKDRLGELRKTQEANKQPTGYDGHCRGMSPDEAKEKVKVGEEHVVRMKMPEEGTTKFEDLIRGEVEFKNELIDDQVILKADGFPTYHLAVVVDDHLMGTTHVIRGEEWLPSTPKHVQLYQMFGWDLPEFAHLPLLVNEKKQKLSKRHGDVSVEDYKEKGYLQEALVNFIAFLGWNPGDERELFTLAELEKEFDIAKVGKASAVFNLQKLDWYNQQYMKSMDISELTKRAKPFFISAGLIDESVDMKWLEKVVKLEQDRAATLKDMPEALGFLFSQELDYDPALLAWKKSTKEDAIEKLKELLEFLQEIDEKDWTEKSLDTKVGEWIKEKGYGVGDVLWPMRVALSGQKNSPGPYEIAGVLGKEKTIQRVQIATKLIS